MMKKVLVGLSAVALGFLFVKEFQAIATPAANEAQPAVLTDGDEDGTTGNKTTDVATVVQKALAFKALLNTSQQGTLEQAYTPTLARRWSNLPVSTMAPRNGIRFDALTSAQLAAAYEVVQAAAGFSANEGYDEFLQILSADSFLSANGGGNQYGKGLYFLAYLNTPSTTGAWMLQFGGHHYAANISFNGGQVVSATPWHQAVEPLSISTPSGTKTPQAQERAGLVAMFGSLTSAQLSSAQLSGTFGDIQLGASSSLTTNFPATPVGLACSTLTTAQKALVLDAMKPWVTDADTATANALLAIYNSEMDSTFIGWAGSSNLTASGNYARIDGPSVWIEFACQNGVVLSGIHYHTIWRDQKRDYGKELTATSLNPTGINDAVAPVDVTAYPNPATDRVHIIFPTHLTSANVQVVNVASGQTMQMLMGRRGPVVELNTERLAPGYYVVRINDNGKEYVGKFSKR